MTIASHLSWLRWGVVLVLCSALGVSCSSDDDGDAGPEVDQLDLIDDEVESSLESGEVDDWVPWTSPDGGFSVEVPGEPVVNEIPVDLPDGTTMQMSTASLSSGTTEYAVTWFDVGPAFDFDGALDGAAANVGGEVTASESATLAGMEARRFDIEVPSGPTIISIVAHDGTNRSYQLLVAGTLAVNRADLDRMIDTFVLQP